jgi:hypothetical protein
VTADPGDRPEVVDVLPRDAIPGIDDPAFGPDFFGDPDDEMVVVDIGGGPARAYPVRILSYHEVVNDTIDGRPVAVTWCPICGSAVVYDRVVDGRTLTFGVSGKLADDALLLYDRETGSEWQQSTGRCLEGAFAGTTLEVLPAALVPYEQFRDANPDGQVVQPAGAEGDDAARERYDMAPYERYEAGETFGLYGMRGTGEPRSWDREDLDPKIVVLGVEVGDDAVGYPRPRVADAGGVVRDTVGDRGVLVCLAGDELHAYADPGFPVEQTDDPGVYRGDGTRWAGATGAGEDGRRLERLPARRLYAFAWQDVHGPEAFYDRAGARPS